jgi:hypothetical protein
MKFRNKNIDRYIFEELVYWINKQTLNTEKNNQIYLYYLFQPAPAERSIGLIPFAAINVSINGAIFSILTRVF